jgi:hypothetical protein
VGETGKSMNAVELQRVKTVVGEESRLRKTGKSMKEVD